MHSISILGLIHNLALLLSAAFIFDLATAGWSGSKTIFRQVISGAAIGLLGIATMLVPWTFAPGIILDSRSILLGISGLFFGWIPTATAMTITAGYRLLQGGEGAWTGIFIILSSGTIGIAWRHLYRRPLINLSWHVLYVFGMVIHLTMLMLIFTLPWDTALKVLSMAALPLILVYPAGVVFLGMLLVKRLQRKKIRESLIESERLAFSTIDALTERIAVLDENDTIIADNKAWRDFAASNPAQPQPDCETTGYISICDTVHGARLSHAQAFAQGIRAVRNGETSFFSMEYPCHTRPEKRWFLGKVSRFSDPGPIRIVVAHENITERKLAEENVRHYQDHLESLVRERTHGLEEKNAQLTLEIEKRRQANQAIRESEERYRMLVELTPGIIYRIKEDGIIDFISPAVRQLGYDPAELAGKPLVELVHPDDRDRCRDLLVERRIGNRRLQNLDVRLLEKTGRPSGNAPHYSFVQISARGYWDVPDTQITRPDKTFLYTLGIAHDITRRKQAEQDLEESRKRLSLLKDVASAANAAATPEDALKVATDGIARYIGWPVGHVYIAGDEDPGVLVPSDIWHIEDEEKFGLFKQITEKTTFQPGKGLIGRVLKSKKTLWVQDVTTYQDFHRIIESGDIGLFGAFAFPVIVHGQVAAVLEFFSTDIEKPNSSLIKLMNEIGIQLGIVIERKQIEKERDKLAKAVEYSPATVIITDVTGKIQYANPKFTELTGYSLEEAMGKNPRILNSGFHSRQFYKKLWETIIAGRNWYGTFRNKGKNGNIYWERASISPIRDEHGRILNFVAVKEDITRLRKFENELKKAKETAELASRAKSNFLAGMSHELRTPLNAIIGFSEVLKDQYFGPLAEKQQEYIDDILESGKHLLSLINDILDLSRIEAGKAVLDLSKVNVSGLIDNSLTMIKEKAMRHGITLARDISPEVTDLEVTADERKLRQVLYNLLSNAAKFTPDGGTIKLFAKTVYHPGTGADEQSLHSGFLEISVKDSGIGISSEQLEKIFSPFYQVSDSRQGKSPGTGLGLPLSRDLVELHNGRLYVESDGEGKGSTFSFQIPVTRETT